jgi:hypothetical protein
MQQALRYVKGNSASADKVGSITQVQDPPYISNGFCNQPKVGYMYQYG